MIRKILMAATLLALAGCGGTPPLATSPLVERAPEDTLPAPLEVGPDGEYAYTLGPLDTISVDVDGMPALLREVVIDSEGMMSFPMAGSVKAAGLSTTQLARALEAKMRENYVLDPKVNVNIVLPVSNSVTVDGEVNKPGIYPVYRDMTLIQAVAQAGGNTEFARTSIVMVFRNVGEQQYVGVYDLKGIRYGNYADPKIYPDDRIVVSESETRRLIQTIQPLVTLITTPLIYLIRQ